MQRAELGGYPMVVRLARISRGWQRSGFANGARRHFRYHPGAARLGLGVLEDANLLGFKRKVELVPVIAAFEGQRFPSKCSPVMFADDVVREVAIVHTPRIAQDAMSFHTSDQSLVEVLEESDFLASARVGLRHHSSSTPAIVAG